MLAKEEESCKLKLMVGRDFGSLTACSLESKIAIALSLGSSNSCTV
jgi:hypothetical protein